MATRYNYTGGIITDGLVLNLDAAKVDSYPGTGTTWRDLSGNNNNGTLTNGPTFSGIGKQASIVFDGVDDYALLPTNFFNHNAGTPFTVSFWFKTSTSGGVLFGQQATNTPNVAEGWVPAIYIDTSGRLLTSCFWGGNTGNISSTSGNVTDGTWKNIVVTFQSNSHISYLNGSSYATLTKTQTQYSSTYYYFIGSGKYSSWSGAGASPYFAGSVSQMMFYNRALSADEVSQNFNALRSRYGI
jgi:hypothetical protein